MSNSNNNQLNIPQAREAMDRFKMQAAQDNSVFLPQVMSRKKQIIPNLSALWG